MAALAPSLSTAPVVPSPRVALSQEADEEEEEAPFAPVLSFYRRHLIGGDLEDSIVSRHPREFRYVIEEASGGEMICAEEVEASPVFEEVDGNPVSPLFRGAFK
eukprot:Cvel_32725.t1-p1 / transcript=Cvel_32725.t1 / gene=Cvel_32725 / organism=Chromera_velia_CCMP2878 / gene_product=hypothetical protein / transcript_product=hypothetical protein / location=Cvel_scaffold5158:1511-2988(-) / protein_length=103 / sequence_SO=supercontig / SO=protein_coding / is_pseudo=false